MRLLSRLATAAGRQLAFRDVLREAGAEGMNLQQLTTLRRQAVAIAREYPETGDKVHHARLMLAEWKRANCSGHVFGVSDPIARSDDGR